MPLQHYTPNEYSHPGKSPGYYERAEVETMETERQAYIKTASNRVLAAREKAEAAADKERQATIENALNESAQKQVADLKASAKLRFPGSAAEFESAWDNGLREEIVTAETLRNAEQIRRDAAAYVRGRF